MRIYVASSWRNQYIAEVVKALREEGHHVYDFREDDGQGAAFNWRDIDPNWQKWTKAEFAENIFNPIADRGFNRDMGALKDAEALVLVMPCGRSAHLELGYAIGRGIPTAILLTGDSEPELMYRAASYICLDIKSVISMFGKIEQARQETFKMYGSRVTKTPYPVS